MSGKDPFICRNCGREMILWKLWHPDYGFIYDEEEGSPCKTVQVSKNHFFKTGATISSRHVRGQDVKPDIIAGVQRFPDQIDLTP